MMDTEKVKNLKKNNNITLTFQGEDMLFIEASGKGKLLTSKTMMQKFWTPELDRHKQYEGKLKV